MRFCNKDHSMKDFSHIIITRFNLRDTNWNEFTKNNKPVLTNKWMEDRLDLFVNFCLPSVINQSNSNFEWWVFFDSTTPISFMNLISQLDENHEKFSPIYIDGMTSFLPSIKNRLSALDSKYIITSRLDNDDCIHRDYVSVLQSHFDFQDFLALDVIDGLTLQIQPTVKFGYQQHYYNPFISLIEKNENPKSVWFSRHADWKRESRLIRLKNQRLWMSVIHQDNKVNQYHGFGRLSITNELELFGIKKKYIQSLNSELTYSWTLNLLNWLKTRLNNNFKDFKRNLGLYRIK